MRPARLTRNMARWCRKMAHQISTPGRQRFGAVVANAKLAAPTKPAAAPLPVTSKTGLVAVAYLPHGTMTLDPTRKDLPKGARELHAACVEAGRLVAAADPDLVVLSTPHGLYLCDSVGVYQPAKGLSQASGSADWKGEWADYAVDVRIDSGAAKSLLEYTRSNASDKYKVEGLTAFAGLSTPLRWGEVVPLWFIARALRQRQSPQAPADRRIVLERPEVVIFSQPRGLGCTDDAKTQFKASEVSQMVTFGQQLRAWCDLQPRRVALVISGDLAHTHSYNERDCPAIYKPDPHSGFTTKSEAKPLDVAMTNFARSLHGPFVTRDAKAVEHIAYACGYSGMLVMHGVLGGDNVRTEDWNGGSKEDSQLAAQMAASEKRTASPSADRWERALFEYQLPSYYGMLVSVWLRS